MLRDCLTLSFVTHRHDLDGNPDGLISYCAVLVNVQTAADLLDSEDFPLLRPISHVVVRLGLHARD